MPRLLARTVWASLIIMACSSGPPSGTAVSPAPPNRTTAPATAPPTPALPAGITSFELGFSPSGIVAAGDAIWAEDHAQTNRVYAIDPATGGTIGSLAVARPCDLAFGLERLWVADLNRGALVWIDPKSREIGGEVEDLPGACGPQIVGDAVWLAVDSGLARIDPDTLVATVTELGGPLFPGAGEPLWGVSFTSGEVIRVAEGTGKVISRVDAPGGVAESQPLAIGLGSLWVANDIASRVYRLDVETGSIQAEMSSAPATRLLVTKEAIWLTSYATGMLERIDPETNRVTFSAPIGGNPNGIAEGFGAIWVADTRRGLLFRVDPTAAAG